MCDLSDKLRSWAEYGLADNALSTTEASALTKAADELDARAATIEALQKRVAELEGDQWRPIETAPKDGRAIYDSPMPRENIVLLAFDPRDVGQYEAGICVGYWDAYYDVGGGGYREGGSPWVIANCGETTDLHYGLPTHWMPLPKEPTP